jgi:two-component system, chemotaxis family, sensor kinase CheA
MDELLAEFLTETGERLDELDVNLVRFEREPNDAEMLNTIFRLVHTIKGTCGFLDLDRLAKLAHAAETLMGQYRDGAPVTVEGVSVILSSLDRMKDILSGLAQTGTEPHGSDDDLITALEDLAEASAFAQTRGKAVRETPSAVPSGAGMVAGTSPLHATLEELERAWQEAPGPDAPLEPEVKPAQGETAPADEDEPIGQGGNARDMIDWTPCSCPSIRWNT